MRLLFCFLLIQNLGCLSSCVTDGAANKSVPVKPAVESKQSGVQQVFHKVPIIEIKTSEGLIVASLDPARAPATVRNFLSLVDKEFYDGTVFHRVIKGFVIQGGGFTSTEDGFVEKKVTKDLKNEGRNGLKNSRLTLAMARTSEADSAGAQFFINLAANHSLDYPKPDGFGYAVFGKVDSGAEVADKIAAKPTGSWQEWDNVPLNDITIISIRRKSP